MSATNLFDAVQHSKDIKQELKALKCLEEHLLSKDVSTEEQNTIDEEYLHNVNLDVSSTPETFFTQQEVFNRFVYYVFVRRFGWSEASDGINSGYTITDPEHKSQINELLGNILHWFHDNDASNEVLTSLIYTLKQAQSKPVVRSQTVMHIMDLLRQAGPNIHSSIYDTAKSAIILSLTDVWSPIRSACISRLGYVIENFTIQQLHVFFTDLIDICRDTTSTWQAIEGAVMGINTVIRKFQWIGILPDSDFSEVPPEDAEETAKCEFILKFGTSEFTAMPEFISRPLEDAIYTLLASSQLSIRENAIKCYSAYLGRCELKVAIRTLTELVSKLNPADADVKNEALFLKQFVFLSDFEAEGLLGVCVHLVKQIPSQHLLPLWTDCSPVFSMYLGHAACTVRQVSSTIFKFVVAKNSSSPDVLKLVLSNLCHQWLADMVFLSHDQSSVHHVSAPSAPYAGMHSRITLKKWLASKRDGTKLTQVWEWREGRLLAYELILQFLIKNHWLYTFGSANLGPLSSSQDIEPSHSSDNMANTDRLPSRGSGRVLYHSMKTSHGSHRYESQRRSSCNSPVQDVYIERPRTSSESIHASSQPMDVPTMQCHHNVHCSHHRLCSTSTGGSLGSTHEVRLSGRMPTVYGCGASSIKSYGRHYSYYTKPEDGDKFTISQHSHTACSLLALCLDTEKQAKLAHDDGGDESCKKVILSDVLHSILLQCIESVADARWELRRMGQQLLPCIVEVMRWYDATLVEDFLNKSLKPTTSLLSYGACICLMHSLMHVTRLQQLLQEPPSSWQDVQLCQQLIHSVISCIRCGLPCWLKTVLHLLQRPVADRLTVVAMETVMISVGNFDLNYKEKCMMTKCVLEKLTRIYAYYHPKEELSDYFEIHEFNQDLKVNTEGFLSCRADASTGGPTLQFEKYLLTQIHPLLNQFTDGAPINEVVTLLPLGVTWFGLYLEDDTLLKHLIDCIFCLCNRISLYHDNNEAIDNNIESHCTVAFHQVIKLILNKSIDHQNIRQVLDLCLAFLSILSPDQVVRDVLHAVASRLMVESKPNSGTLRSESGNDKDLYLQSNDVNLSATQIEEIPPSDEDDHLDFISDGPMPETQILNVSGNSNHSVSSHQRSRCNSGDDHQEAAPSDSDSSDWDDWDDEEEDIAGLQTAVCEFLTNLQSKLTNMKRETLLQDHLQHCTDEEHSILQSLIK